MRDDIQPGRHWTAAEIEAIQVQHKEHFLREYSKTANVTRACREAGVDRKQWRRWMEHDEQFSFAFNEAREEAIDALEEEARRRAVDGTEQHTPIFYKGEEVGERVITEYSDTLLMALLKANRPEKYKDRLDVTTTTIVKQYGGIDVEAV